MSENRRIEALEPVRRPPRESASAEIVRRLVAYLQAGHVEPGSKIPSERKLAEALGVGRSVVREALKSLTLLGLVDVRQGDGTYLKSVESDLLPQSVEWGLLLGHKQTQDLVEARRHLEVIIAGLAAQRRSEEDLEALRELLAAMAAAAGDPDRFVAADLAFHYRVTQAAGNASLGGIMNGIQTLLRVWISRVMHADNNFDPSLREHEAILRALEGRDPDATREAMHQHMDGAYQRLAATLDEGVHLPNPPSS